MNARARPLVEPSTADLPHAGEPEAKSHSALDNHPSKPPRWLAAVVILAAGLGVYSNSFQGPFIFDDQPAIVDNPNIRQLWPPSALWKDTTRPLVQFSLAVNYALGELDVWGYHAVNLGIHLAAALVLFGLVRRTLLLETTRPEYQRAASGLGLTVAVLWVVHPLTTAGVTYIIQRAEALMALFYLLVLYFLLRGSQSRRGLPWYLAAVAACFLGMASKEVMVTAPAVALLYDRVFLARTWGEVLRRRWPLYGALAGSWLLLATLMAAAPKVFATVGYGNQQVDARSYALSQPGVILHYANLSVWPYPQALDYGWPAAKGIQEILVPGLVVLGLLLASLWMLVRGLRGTGKFASLGFLATACFIILSPTSSIVPVADLAFEHRMYLPLAALVTLYVMLGYGLSLWIQPRMPRAGLMRIGLVVLIAGIWGGLTWRRNQDYRSEIAIWTQTITARGENARAHDQLGVAMAKSGNLAEAVRLGRMAIFLREDFAVAHGNLGSTLDALGQRQEAIPHYRRAIELDPNLPEPRNSLANALVSLGKLDEARTHYEAALHSWPNSADLHYNYAGALGRMGLADDAIRHYRLALEHSARGLVREPQMIAAAHCNLATALAHMGKYDEAETHYLTAIDLRPNYAQAHFRLGELFTARREIDRAREQFDRVLAIDARHPDTHYHLASLCELKGNAKEAAEHYRIALAARPDWLEVVLRLSWLLATHPDRAVRDGAEAVRLIEPWRQKPEGDANPQVFDTLGAAYAEAGRFREAALAVDQAIQIMELRTSQSFHETNFVRELLLHRNLYRNRLPYRSDR